MIPHSSAGGQSWGHQMRSFNGGPGRIDLAQMSGQYDPPSDISQPLSQAQPPPQTHQPAFVDLTGAGLESHDREPPPKRPKLDVSGVSNAGDAVTVNGAEARSTPGSAGSRPPLSWRGRPLWSFQAVMSEIPGIESRGDNATGSRPSSPPPFPAQPWSIAPPDRPVTGSRSRDSSPDKKVQTTPYRIQTPSVAPKFKGESK
jgi:mediator of RNA polymerase II transcription subunit 12